MLLMQESAVDADALEEEVARIKLDVDRAKQDVAKAKSSLEAARKPVSDDPLVRLDDLAKVCVCNRCGSFF
jgi:hypothetical protein